MNQIKPIGVTEFCKCDKCKGEIDYEIEHMLDPTGKAISKWCADYKTLIIVQNTMPLIPRTNAEYELRQRGVVPFFVIYNGAPLEPVEKFNELHPLFKEIGESLQAGIKFSRLIEDQYNNVVKPYFDKPEI